MSKIRIKEAIIVEGRYDITTLKQLVDATVLETGGFRIFKSRERIEMIRRIAEKRGIIILTDGDGAGQVIRNYIKSAVPKTQVKHAYIPDVYGKEKRKRDFSKEGKLGVEGMKQEVLLSALRQAGATFLDEGAISQHSGKRLTKTDLYRLGLSGGQGSAQKRKALFQQLGLPAHLSANALIDFLNAVSDMDEILEILNQNNV